MKIMVFEKAFTDKLSLFGLNSYESKLWAAILSRGIATAGELSQIANVPRSRCYDVLESLEKKGFIISKIGKPLKYIAVSPLEVLDRVKKTVVEKAENERKKIDSLKDTDIMSALLNLHRTGIDKVDPSDLSAMLKGRKNIYNQFSTLIKGAKKSISLTTTENGLKRKYDKFIKDFKDASDRNVAIKIVAPLENIPQRMIKDLSEYAKIKHSNNASRFILIDNKHLIFMLNNDDLINPNYDMGVWVKSPFFVSTLNQMFNLSWKNFKDAPQ